MGFRRINILICGLLFTHGFGFCSIKPGHPEAHKGHLELASYDLARQGHIELSGQWSFYWHKFLDPRQIRADRIPEPDGYLDTPGTFNSFKIKGRSAGPLGYGSYLLKIEGLGRYQEQNLAFYMKDALTAYRLFLIPASSKIEAAKPRALMTNGNPGSTQLKSVPQHLPLLRPFRPESDSVYILVHISNFHDNLGGLVYPLELGLERDLLQKQDYQRSIDFLVLGVLLMTGLYHLGLFMVRRKDRASLLFAILNLLIILRVLLTRKYIQQWFPEPSTPLFEILMKLDYATFYFAMPVFFAFILHLFPGKRFNLFWQRLLHGLWIVVLLFAIGFFWPQRVYAEFLLYYEIITILVFIVIIWISICAIMTQKTGALTSLLGILVLLAVAINDILHASEIISTEYLLSYGLIAFIFSQSYILTRQFAEAYERVEHLTENLQQEVASQTIELQQKNRKLEQVDSQKSLFFQNIAHEIRTPLTLIDGPLQEILADETEQRTKPLSKHLEMMQRNTRHLLRLVNQLLDISRLEAGKMPVKLERYNLVQQVKNIAETFRLMAQQKHLRFDLSLPNETLMIEADFDKINKVIYNLLSNAIKFTEAGTGRDKCVSISLERIDSDSQNQALLQVKDDGLGIDAEDLPYIFDRFHQAKQTRNRQQEGTGIGLSIVKEFIKLHKGHIEVQSEPRKGSTFQVYLNLAKNQDSFIESDTSTADSSQHSNLYTADAVVSTTESSPENQDGIAISELDPAKKTILLVEDNIDVRVFIFHILHQKYNLVHAEHALAALAKLNQFIPDLIISDYMMPHMDGIEFISNLKNQERLGQIPVLLLTAGDHRIFRQSQIQVDGFLAKPFRIAELRQTVARFLDTQSQST